MAAKAKQLMLMMFSSSFSYSLPSAQIRVSPVRRSASVWVPTVRHPRPTKWHCVVCCRSISTDTSKKKKRKDKGNGHAKGLAKEKRRTRSLRDCDIGIEIEESDDNSSASVLTMQSQDQSQSHIPVMLGEVLDVFSSNSKPLCSFLDCTLGAGGHSSAIIQAHPHLKLFIGMDVDPLALQMAQSRIHALSHSQPRPQFRALTFLSNFKNVKSVLSQVDNKDILSSGVDGILMDLGMSSMQVNNPKRGFSVLGNGPLDMRMDPQASLTAEDILNSWPDSEVGRILRDYGEESNWRLLQNKILQARHLGGLHTTGELVDVIRSATPRTRGGRQGWIKTATRVFQALRIAVNDELKTLEDSLYACFDCLAPGGRLAVISFHSLEDRIVKQTFLKIIDSDMAGGDGSVKETDVRDSSKMRNENNHEELWIRQTIQGRNGTVLTKRPITPSEKEEELNRRSRSAKLRVIQKVCT